MSQNSCCVKMKSKKIGWARHLVIIITYPVSPDWGWNRNVGRNTFKWR